MLKALKPDMEFKIINDIDLNALQSRGIKNILIDMDNTITPWNKNEITAHARRWIMSAKEMGFSICIISNNRKKRVRSLAEELNILSSPKGGKPFSRAFKGAMSLMNASTHETAVIGDQIFTDILGGNRLKLYTILVDPLSKKEFIMTRITRWMEKIVAGRR